MSKFGGTHGKEAGLPQSPSNSNGCYGSTMNLSSPLKRELKKWWTLTYLLKFIYFYRKRQRPSLSYFRKNFELAETPEKAFIQCLPFQYAEIFVNGIQVGEVERRYALSYMHNVHGIKMFDITQVLHTGTNSIAVKVTSYTGRWPILNLYGEIYVSGALHAIIYSNKSWFAAAAPVEEWETCELDVRKWKHVDSFGKPPHVMGALYYPDFERGLVSHHTKNLGYAAERLSHIPSWFGWLFRLIAWVAFRRQLFS